MAQVCSDTGSACRPPHEGQKQSGGAGCLELICACHTTPGPEREPFQRWSHSQPGGAQHTGEGIFCSWHARWLWTPAGCTGQIDDRCAGSCKEPQQPACKPRGKSWRFARRFVTEVRGFQHAQDDLCCQPERLPILWPAQASSINRDRASTCV